MGRAASFANRGQQRRRSATPAQTGQPARRHSAARAGNSPEESLDSVEDRAGETLGLAEGRAGLAGRAARVDAAAVDGRVVGADSAGESAAEAYCSQAATTRWPTV